MYSIYFQWLVCHSRGAAQGQRLYLATNAIKGDKHYWSDCYYAHLYHTFAICAAIYYILILFNRCIAYIMLGKTAEYRHEYSSDILLVAIAIVPSF
jgi:hypothetical protein